MVSIVLALYTLIASLSSLLTANGVRLACARHARGQHEQRLEQKVGVGEDEFVEHKQDATGGSRATVIGTHARATASPTRMPTTDVRRRNGVDAAGASR